MREKVLQELQKKEEDKVMMSFKTDLKYKHIFEKVCKHEGYSMSSVLNALLKTYVNEFFEQEYKNIRKLSNEFEVLHREYGSGLKDLSTQEIKKFTDALEILKSDLLKENNSIMSISDNKGTSTIGDVTYDEKLIPDIDNIDYSAVVDPLISISYIEGILMLQKDKK